MEEVHILFPWCVVKLTESQLEAKSYIFFLVTYKNITNHSIHWLLFLLRANSLAISLSSSGDGGLGPSGGYTTYWRFNNHKKNVNSSWIIIHNVSDQNTKSNSHTYIQEETTHSFASKNSTWNCTWRSRNVIKVQKLRQKCS